jgi:hypothetical protein
MERWYMTDFKKGLLATAIPLVLLGLLSTAGPAFNGLYIAWFLGALGWLGAFITMLVLAISGRQRYVAGIVTGLALGFLALFTTCFVNLSQYR